MSSARELLKRAYRALDDASDSDLTLTDDLRHYLSQPEPEPVALYPCGFDRLVELVIQDGAYIARELHSDEPLTDNAREAIARMISRSKDMASLLAKQPLYTTPPDAAKRIAELYEMLDETTKQLDFTESQLIKAEAKLAKVKAPLSEDDMYNVIDLAFGFKSLDNYDVDLIQATHRAIIERLGGE